VKPLKAGQALEGLTIRLPGATRIKGLVRDATGQPIRDVVCLVQAGAEVTATTGPAGQFDLGWVPVPKFSRVSFRPPRPSRGNAFHITYPHDSMYYPMAPGGRRTFFHHRNEELSLKPGSQTTLDVVLSPARLLELTGTVSDEKGRPVSKAKVHLFTGDAGKNRWLATVNPSFTSSVKVITDTVLAGTVTDKQGQWRLWIVGDGSGPLRVANPKTDWSKYCIGVQAPGGRNVLVRDVEIPKDAPHWKQDIKLPAK